MYEASFLAYSSMDVYKKDGAIMIESSRYLLIFFWALLGGLIEYTFLCRCVEDRVIYDISIIWGYIDYKLKGCRP